MVKNDLAAFAFKVKNDFCLLGLQELDDLSLLGFYVREICAISTDKLFDDVIEHGIFELCVGYFDCVHVS